jgi:prevent-host-death family protein
MRLSASIKPISYLKANAARLIRDLSINRGTIVITQNGEAKAIVQDISTYEQTQESLALLKMLTQSKKSVDAGHYKPLSKSFKDLRARIQESS